MIVFDKVSKSYGSKQALKEVSFTVKPQEFVTLVGPSGAGKTTIIKLLICEEYPTLGTVTINDKNIHLLKKKHIPYYRRQIGVIYQDFKLLPHKTVFENVAFAMEVGGQPGKVIKEEAEKILKLVGLSGRGESFPGELSAGEAQRVAIARALVFEPRFLIADEPTGNLDPKTAWEIIQLLLKINRMGTTVLLATHNREIVNRLGQRVITIVDGGITSDKKHGRYEYK